MPTAIKFALILGSLVSITNCGSALVTGKNESRSLDFGRVSLLLFPYAVSIYSQPQRGSQDNYLDQDRNLNLNN